MQRARLAAFVVAGCLGGSLSAHAVGAISHTDAREVGEMSHRAIGVAPIALATLTVVLVVMALTRNLVSRRALSAILAATPVIAFALQEGFERLLSTESSPFEGGHEPGVLGIAVALLPWVLAAFLLARVAIAIVRIAAARAGAGVLLVPPTAVPELAPRAWLVRSGRHDSILDRPPRAPPYS